MKEQIIRLLGQKNYVPANVPELLALLNLTPNLQQDLQAVLRELEQSGDIARIKGNRYVSPREADLVPGRIRMNRAGKGFLQPDDSALPEIAIPENATGTALHEDRVLVRRDARRRNFREGDTDTGTVIRVLKRQRARIVGTLQRGRQFLFVTPDDPRIPHDILVPEPRDVGRPARIGDKVVVELNEWESRNANPDGIVVEVLGAPDAEGVDMLSVLRQYDLPLHFPTNVLDEANAIGSTVDPRDIAGRVDCRSHKVVTIDPDDAKDFDDAICLERISAEQWRLWVHIADVSNYVKPGTALDTEAKSRGNSTYLVDRVIPMLPEALSNELCSLKPNVDRLTKCVEFIVSNDGRVVSTKFYSAIIHSQKRFAYAQVLAILQRAPTDDPIERMLHQAHELAQKIRKLRFKNGSLELDFPETKIRLDDQGKILRIEKNENDVSHQLIEEYMLLANEAVATRLMALQTPAIYRIHEEPDAKRLAEYRQEVLSHHVACGNLNNSQEVQKLLQKLGTLPIGAALKIGFLKSLMRARYAIEPLGHYGLAKKKYTHFTSPIRRYADLVVHRALFDKNPASGGALKEVAEHISVTERNSADAERDSKDVKLFAFLRAQIESGAPIKYPALVTDVRNFGFFVDVPGLAMSGLVPLSLIKDDFFVFDESRRNLVGRRTRKTIRLGDNVTVQVARVDTAKKQVDFGLAAEDRKLAGQKPALQKPVAQKPTPQKPATPSRPPPLRATAHRPFDNRPQPSRPKPRPEAKRPASARSENSRPEPSRRTDSRKPDARKSDSRPTEARPAKFSSSAARPQFGSANKPMFKTSVRPIGSNQRRRK